MELSLGVADLAPDGSPVLVGDTDKQQQALVNLAAIVVGRLTTPTGPSAETCKLMSLDEAVAMVGLPLSSAVDVDNHDAWGPACRYNGADGNAELLVAVNSQAAAVPHYDECKANFETIIGVGQEALYSVSCPIQVEFQSISNPLLVRSGATVVAVGEGGQLETEQARALEVDVARLVLQRLGLDPGSTPGPVASSVLVHPCALVSNAEVAAAVGVEIDNQSESSAGENVNAMCTYRTADENEPLRMDVGTGQYALHAFGYFEE